MNTIRPVRKGVPFSREVQGGVYRTPAPSDGLVIDLADKDVFLDAIAVAIELRKLGYTVESRRGK